MRIVFLLVAASALIAQAQAQYDLVIKGGHVVDGKAGLSAVRDVAIDQGKIAEVAADIPASKARKLVDASGLYVTPGLVDIHVHVYAGTGQRNSYAGDNSVYPDGFTLRSGVTTAVDAGSSGWRDFPDFKDKVIDRSITRMLAFLNIVGHGMRGTQTEDNLEDMDSKATAEQVKKYKDTIVGIKTAHYRGPEWTPVERAVEAGKLAGVPIMVDFGQFRSERPFEELVTTKLRPGDIYTHTYLGRVPMLDEQGHVRQYIFDAQKRGVIFDVGHGGGSFVWRQAVPAIKQGFLPNSISTDLHITSMNAGMKDMTNVMSKFLNLGMSVDDVIIRSTWNPAREIRREEFGNLSVGAPGDVTVLRLMKGDFGFIDIEGSRMAGNQKLICELTVKGGKVVYDLNGLASEDWTKVKPRPTRVSSK